MKGAFRWSRVVVTSLTLIGVASVITLTPIARQTFLAWRQDVAARPKPKPCTDDDWRKIVVVVYQSGDAFPPAPPPPPPPPGSTEGDLISRERFLEKWRQRPMVLEADSTLLCEPDDLSVPANPACKAGSSQGITSPWEDDLIPMKLRRELVLANQLSYPVPVPPGGHFIAASSAEIREIFDGKDGWDDFYAKYPSAAGLMTVSQPVLSEDGNRALIYVTSRCDGMCGTGFVCLMERIDGGWKIVRSEMIWIS